MVSTTAADGATLAYATAGDTGSTIVLVHGITESHGAWDPIVKRLVPTHRVIAVDLRGHGASERRAPYDVFTMAGDLDAVLRAEGAGDAIVVGHSLGGVVVSAYAAAGHPARGIVDVDQSLDTSGFKDALAMLEPALRGSREEFVGAIDIVFSALAGPLPASERTRMDALSSPEQDVVMGVWDFVLTTSADDLRALAASMAEAITLPYLSLHGSDMSEYEQWLTAHVPHATYECWPDHGHYPHLVDPDRFAARIEAFDRAC